MCVCVVVVFPQAIMAINPFKPGESNLMDDTDLAGPLLFCLLYGGFLLLVC